MHLDPGEDVDLVTATMKRAIRSGKVFVDWSQNSGFKTTVAPYSLRGRAEPWVAAPRPWEELGNGGLEHLHFSEVLTRLDTDGDLLDGLEGPARKGGSGQRSAQHSSRRSGADRSKKSGGKKPSSSSSSDDDSERGDHQSTEVEGCDTGPTSPIFVIQEHHARRLHFDLRLEHYGVLASWAVPKNLPTEPKDRRLAVHTEDHPLGYQTSRAPSPRANTAPAT
jgi:bifunctional non-homologous end joining protein LigD